MTLADPNLALAQLVTAVTALKLPAAYDAGDPPVPVAAFSKVKIFDLQDLAKAMEELFLYDNRIALIGLDAVNHDHTISGRTLTVDRTLSVTIIMADRRYSDRQKAMVGDSTTPGALLLQKVLVDGIAGELPLAGVVCAPGAGRLVALENEKRKDETGRILFAQDFTLYTSYAAVSLSRIAKIASS